MQNNIKEKNLEDMVADKWKYLTFRLDNETYAIDVMKVREIIGLLPITRVPRTPEFIKGVINLRGQVIPIIDLRMRFEMPVVEYDERACVIVVEIPGGKSLLAIGLIVDSVNEVLPIDRSKIDPTPSFGEKVSTEFIKGIARVGDGVLTILDIDKVFSDMEKSNLESVEKRQ